MVTEDTGLSEGERGERLCTLMLREGLSSRLSRRRGQRGDILQELMSRVKHEESITAYCPDMDH